VTDPLTQALADALAAHGITDPAAIQVAAEAAVAVLGRDRCTCRAATHHQHHQAPVDGCPWCTPAPTIRPARQPAVTDVQAGGVL
jgi:hypothetical protein